MNSALRANTTDDFSAHKVFVATEFEAAQLLECFHCLHVLGVGILLPWLWYLQREWARWLCIDGELHAALKSVQVHEVRLREDRCHFLGTELSILWTDLVEHHGTDVTEHSTFQVHSTGELAVLFQLIQVLVSDDKAQAVLTSFG